MKKYIMVFDEGTTSCRCLLFDHDGTVCGKAQQEFTQFFPKPGWVEHDAMEILQTQIQVAKQAMERTGILAKEIAAIGITDQRETTVVWDKRTGKPIAPAIVWQCRRTADFCEEQKQLGMEPIFREKTGLRLDPYFSATKLHWILEHVDGARAEAERGNLLFGTMETWLIWNLTGGKLHITDYSNASRTMLFNIHTMQWDTELLSILKIPASMLPTPVPSSQLYGETDSAVFGERIPISGAAGDQQAALFGQGCFSAGSAKNTYGTGCFLLMNTGNHPIPSKNGLLTTIAWGINGSVTYALEGSVFSAGSSIQWLRDGLSLIQNASETEALAREVPDTNGCYMVPAFTGLGAPYWDPHARGMVVGLTRGTTRQHMIRAALASIAFQTQDVLSAMESDTGLRLQRLNVDGGAAANRLLLEMQADYSRIPVYRTANLESTGFGAALLAGLGVGFWNDLKEVQGLITYQEKWMPIMSEAEREVQLQNWKKAVSCACMWSKL